MTDVLRKLIDLVEEAVVLAARSCERGHDWVSVGGRACPQDYPENCSQSVYQCRVCGTYDYGEAGGPGASDCERYCRHVVE